jgi:HK97 family phage portal protein
VSLLPVRLKAAELEHVRRAGYQIVAARRKSSIFGSMFSWFPSITFGRPTFWPAAGESKAPVNAVNSNSGQIVTPASALTISAVWACTWLIARTIATLPLDLKAKQSNGAGKLALDSDLYEVLRYQPNELMTATDFWQMQLASLLIWGGGYSHKIRRPNGDVIALDPMRPEFTTVYKTQAGKVRYRYDDPLNPRDYAADEVFHLKDRTLDGLTGASVIEYGRHSMGLAQAAENSASKTFKKGLNASGFLKVDKFLTKPQREEFRASIEEFTGEGDKAGGTMVLEGPASDYKQIALKPLDAELLSSRQFSVEDVCRWFNTPPIMIGHASAGQTMWGSGVEQIFSGWTRLCIRPYLTVISQAIRQQLLTPAQRATLYAEFDLDELMAADSAARASLYSTLVQNAIATRNECRDKEGLPPMEGGDILTVQSNLIPLEQLGQTEPGTNAAAEQVKNALLTLLQIKPNEAKP